MDDQPKRLEVKRISLFEIRNATVRSELQEKLHAMRGVLTDVARRDCVSDQFKTDAKQIEHMLVQEIARLD